MKDNLIRLAVYVGLPALTYFGFIEGHDGPRYLATAAVWMFYLPVGIVAALSTEFHAKIAADPVPPRGWRFLDRYVAWFVLVTIVWAGHFWTATAWALYMFCAAICREGVERIRTTSTTGA